MNEVLAGFWGGLVEVTVVSHAVMVGAARITVGVRVSKVSEG
jgi:hypothetical protein